MIVLYRVSCTPLPVPSTRRTRRNINVIHSRHTAMTQAFSIYSSYTSPAGDLAYMQDPLLVVDDGRYTHGVDGNVLPNTVLLDYKGNTIAGLSW